MRKFAREACLLLGALVLASALASPARAALPLSTTRDGLPSLAPVLEPVTPAVVNISVLQRSPEEQNPLLRDPFFRRFFGLPERPQQGLSAGSGVIVDARNGYIITNHHVIKDASAIVVTLKDNRRLPARLVGSDPGTDIALVKVEAKGLVEAKLGDSDALAVGDFVVAIGNPFGIGQTVTSGIVSALGRSGISPEGYENFIQTDAPINPGNSGGALIDLRGEVIGINSAIIGPGGGNVGIGFAVPSNMARAVMQQLIRFGEVRRGRLGIVMQDLTPDVADSLGIGRRTGAVLAEVQPGSPAAAAGLRVGDVVVSLNGRPVHGSAELRAHLGVIPAGDTIELRILRGREERKIRVRIAEVQARHELAGKSIELLAGAEFADAERGGERAILVTQVAADTVAFQYGLRPGDLIIGVNSKRVRSVTELTAALRADGRIVLSVVRGDFLVAVPVR